MKIIAFLGNPGKKYIKNRHNVGFIIGEIFAAKFNIPIKKKEFHSICGKGSINTAETLLLFPATYMNRSGLAISEAIKYYNQDPVNLIVVHDETELPFGEFKLKFAGGHKGHNGIRSIIQDVGSPDFKRIRIGVGRPESEISMADFLLSDFTKEEFERLNILAPDIIELILSTIND